MTGYWAISGAGFAATAITYGPARMGFGLFLNEFRAAFEMSAGTAGLISAVGFSGFLLALPAAYRLAARIGPRTPVLLGVVLGGLGMALIAGASSVAMLGAGAFLAMTSAGFSWAPFNAAVNHTLPQAQRPDALSIISTGTSIGIIAAALAALVTNVLDITWRIGWAGFALAGALAAAGAALALRGVSGGRAAPDRAWRRLATRRAAPLYAIALVFGAASTVYISFAADGIESAGGVSGLPEGTSSSLVFAILGLAGLAGLVTGRIGKTLGLAMMLRALFAACALSFGLLALAPGGLAAVAASAALQGAFVMMISATLAFWSEQLFADTPSMSFTAALAAAAVGGVLGPLGAGYAIDATGFSATFAAGAALSAIPVGLIRSRRPVERDQTAAPRS